MKIRPLFQLLFVLLVVLGVYYPMLFAPSTSLDDQRMLQGLMNTDPATWWKLFIHGTNRGYYRPLLMATFYADQALWFLSESFMHLENVLLHAWNSLWVFGLAWQVRRILNAGDRWHWAPLVAALLFAVHPVNAEAVCWISGRTDVLAAAFLLPAVFLLLLGLRLQRPWLGWLGALLFFAACLSKETAIFFFPAGAFFCFWRWQASGNRFWRNGSLRALLHYGGWGVALALYFGMRYAAKPFDKGVHQLGKAAGGELYSLLDTLRIFFKAGGFYIKKLFFPWPLNFAILGASNWYVPLGVVFVLTIVLWLWRHRLVDMVFLSMACLISSAMLVPLLNATWTPLAERYLYLASAFFVVALVFSLAELSAVVKPAGFFALFTALVLGLFGWTTYARTLQWQDNLALYEDTDKKTPNFAPVRNELAIALLKKGHKDKAEEIFKSNKLKKNGHNQLYMPQNKAMILWNDGQYDEARKLFWVAVSRNKRGAVSVLKKYLELIENWSLKERGTEVPAWFASERVALQQELYQRTRDPFYLYQMGKSRLEMGEKSSAQALFQQAYEAAAKNAFYREPARKLAEKLRAEAQ